MLKFSEYTTICASLSKNWHAEESSQLKNVKIRQFVTSFASKLALAKLSRANIEFRDSFSEQK